MTSERRADAVQAAHDYFTRAAQAEAARAPAGAAALQEQLDALDTFHAWLFTKLRAFRRRFKHARASLLASIDQAALKVFLEDVLYQGPLHAELPLVGRRAAKQADGSLAFALDLPATLANRRSVLRDALRTLLGDTAGADAAYLRRSAQRSRGRGGGGGGALEAVAGGQRKHEAVHELLQDGPDVVAHKGDKVSLGTLQVRQPRASLMLQLASADNLARANSRAAASRSMRLMVDALQHRIVVSEQDAGRGGRSIVSCTQRAGASARVQAGAGGGPRAGRPWSGRLGAHHRRLARARHAVLRAVPANRGGHGGDRAARPRRRAARGAPARRRAAQRRDLQRARHRRQRRLRVSCASLAGTGIMTVRWCLSHFSAHPGCDALSSAVCRCTESTYMVQQRGYPVAAPACYSKPTRARMQVPPLRIVRMLHTLLLSLEMQGKLQATSKAAQLDRLFYSLARYTGSDGLDLTASLQVGLIKSGDSLIAQLVGHTPAGEDDGHTCCVSFLNDIDMAAVLDSIDMSQGTPVNIG